MRVVGIFEMSDKQSQQRRGKADGTAATVADRSAVEENRALAPQTARAAQGDEVDGGGRRRGCSSGRPASLCIPGGSPARGDDARSDPRRPPPARGPAAAEARAGDCRQSLRQRSLAKAVAAAWHRADLPAQEESCSSGDTGWSRVAAVSATLDCRTHHRLAGKLPALGRALRPLAPNLPGVLSYCLLHDRLTEGCAIASSMSR